MLLLICQCQNRISLLPEDFRKIFCSCLILLNLKYISEISSLSIFTSWQNILAVVMWLMILGEFFLVPKASFSSRFFSTLASGLALRNWKASTSSDLELEAVNVGLGSSILIHWIVEKLKTKKNPWKRRIFVACLLVKDVFLKTLLKGTRKYFYCPLNDFCGNF